jgi:hypothetical protein
MPYSIAIPVDGQKARADTYGVPVRDAILDLDLRVSQAEVEQQRVLARGRRTTQKTGITNTETGFLRLDDIPVLAGYMYRLSTSGINTDPTSGTPSADETFSLRSRVEFNAAPGVDATTASQMLGQSRQAVNSATQGPVFGLQTFYYASADGYISVLFSGVRQSGVCTYAVFADGSNPIDCTVEYAGVDPGDTAVVL